jgi:hypothetical protein
MGAGLAMALLSALVICQVTKGQALQRIGILS